MLVLTCKGKILQKINQNLVMSPSFSITEAILLGIFANKRGMFMNMYSVKQSDRNSSKTDLFHRPTTYEQHG